jgi:hypothetical protein
MTYRFAHETLVQTGPAAPPPPVDRAAPPFSGPYRFPDPWAAPEPETATYPDTSWARAKADYLAGATAEGVCERYGLAKSSFHARARAEGWRLKDVGGRRAEPVDDLAELEPAPPTLEMAQQAWRRAAEAIRLGKPYQARTWMKLSAELKAAARQEDADARHAQYLAQDRAAKAAAEPDADTDTSDAVSDSLDSKSMGSGPTREEIDRFVALGFRIEDGEADARLAPLMELIGEVLELDPVRARPMMLQLFERAGEGAASPSSLGSENLAGTGGGIEVGAAVAEEAPGGPVRVQEIEVECGDQHPLLGPSEGLDQIAPVVGQEG